MFTPGPWHMVDTKSENFEVLILGPQRQWIADLCAFGDDHLSPEEAEANAHLIAAAPDLYEALAEWHRIAEATGGQSVIRNRVIAALAKARGE